MVNSMNTVAQWTVIVVAAGQGRRFGRPKQLVDLAGRPVVAWSLHVFAGMAEVREVIVVVEAQVQDAMKNLVAGVFGDRLVKVVTGGETRQESVRAGLRALGESPVEGVLIHDGARPLLRADDVRRGMRAVGPGRAALLAVPIVDTVKVVDERGHVGRTMDRSALWAAQTPQFATVRDMRRAHLEAEREAFSATDDAALLEKCGVDVVVVPSYSDNFKITTPGDLARAEAILRRREPVLPNEEEVLLLEAFVSPSVVDAILSEIERWDGDVDGIDRDLPQSVAIRAYLPSTRLREFRAQFERIAGRDATFTTRFSHSMARL
jgi:2-C-methyl-D-erythritol 4-phosphate cytidylyltransferase